MRRPRRWLLAPTAAAGMAASLLVPGTAQAASFGSETDYAVVLPSGNAPADWGDDYECVGATGVTVCVLCRRSLSVCHWTLSAANPNR
jgi:hypothetical protein